MEIFLADSIKFLLIQNVFTGGHTTVTVTVVTM